MDWLSALIGLAAGVGVTYVWFDVTTAAKSQATEARLYRCTVEAARLVSRDRLNKLSDEELVNRVLEGLGADPSANQKPG